MSATNTQDVLMADQVANACAKVSISRLRTCPISAPVLPINQVWNTSSRVEGGPSGSLKVGIAEVWRRASKFRNLGFVLKYRPRDRATKYCLFQLLIMVGPPLWSILRNFLEPWMILISTGLPLTERYKDFQWFKPARAKYLPLPPSPRGWPIIGNIFDMPAKFQWKAYHSWCEQFNSTVLHMNMAGRHIVVLDTYEDCVELLERRSSLYSGKPTMTMVNELMGWDFSFAWMDYGNICRARRRLMHDAFHPAAVKSFRPIQLRTARKLLLRLKARTNILQEFRQMAGETIMAVAYGLDVQPKDDPYIKAAEEGSYAVLEAAVPGAFLVDSLPVLKYVPEWMPGAGFKRKAREWRIVTEKMLNTPFEAFLRNMNAGVTRPSFSYNALQIAATKGGIYNEENIKYVAGTLYQVGADTTVGVLGFCILTLLDHPECLEKIETEMQSATGNFGRLPDFEDEDSLPYLQAFIKEVMRWWSVTPVAGPHYIEVEDEYKGYRIPAGTTIVTNSWAMLHNEDTYPDPFTFNPDRFLSGDDLKAVNAHFNVTWGFGRRVCAGRYFAAASIWITLAQIVAVYKISKAKDEDGDVIEPSHEHSSSLLLMPEKFECSFILRSKEAERLIVSAEEIEAD